MADYGAQDTSTTTLGANQFPISEAWTPNAGFSAVEGGTQTTDSGGKKSAPVRMEVKDGSDLSGGATTDAAVTGDNPGTRSAKLRGLSKILADIWDSVNHRIKVDGSGVTQPVSGSVSVSNFPGTQPVSGMVTANQGTTPWTVSNAGTLLPYGNIIPGLAQTETWNSIQKFGSLDNQVPSSFSIPSDPVGLTSFSSNVAPTGLQANSGILLQGGAAGTDEIAYTTANYSPGTNPITVTTPIQRSGHTILRFNSLDPMGPKRGGFLPFGLPPVAMAGYNGAGNGAFLLTQVDQNGRLIVAPQEPTWTIYALQTRTNQTANGSFQMGSIQGYTQFLFFFTVSAISGGGSITFSLSNQDFNGNTVTTPFYTSAALTSTQEIEVQVGVGLQIPHVFFQTGLLAWTITGGTTVTFTIEIEVR